MSQEEVARSVEAGHYLAHPKPGDEVVISGITGQFPESDNIYELRDNLFNKVDCVTDDERRWKHDNAEIPKRSGKIRNVDKFDAIFFGVHFKQAQSMDPMCRLMLEKAYEAIVDAGVNPKHLRGSRTGIFVGTCISESERTLYYNKEYINGFGLTGCSRAMLANRISYWLGTTGPSYQIDTACSSSSYAVEHAYRSIRYGHCDAALVGGANLCLHPHVSLQFARLGTLSPDGKCKTFDIGANGYVRSEGIAMIFLQKAKNAKRIYARILHVKGNCDGYKEQGVTYPSGKIQSQLLKEVYEEAGVPPKSLTYVEAHGTGTRVGDPEEANAIDRICCQDREIPLLIGSIKTNIGHTEPASGITGLIKACISMETGYIPPNLHYNSPNTDIKALEEGRMKVVDVKTKLDGDFIGINSFGFGGANCHILVQRWSKEKDLSESFSSDISRLVTYSGRTEESLTSIFNDLKRRPLNIEFIRLLHEIYKDEISGHVYRGFCVLTQKGKGPAVAVSNDRKFFSGEKRPIWFVFSGMGSQWPGMGVQLLKIPAFAEAIDKCHKALEPKGIDLKNVITNLDDKMFDNILNSFIGISAVQIGLVDVLRRVGIVPDNVIGHSFGELACSYADGCFTAEQTILAAYYRGLISITTKFIPGGLAAVGIGYKEIKHLCPPEIVVACHNGPSSSTISGPAKTLKQFIRDLQKKGIFVKEIYSSNIAYHSRYINQAGPLMIKELKEIIPEPKERSSKWISTSVPKDFWNTNAAKYSSAEYHTNNLLSSVLFEEASAEIPHNAIAIEIAPHALMQPILRRSLNENITNISLTNKKNMDSTNGLLTALGNLFQLGLTFNPSNIYPDVPFPVSRGTPMISPLVKWDHEEEWYVASFKTQDQFSSGGRKVAINSKNEETKFLGGHVVNGLNLYPATGYLVLVWETVGLMRGHNFTDIPIVFENIKFLRATSIPKEEDLEFHVVVQERTGNFEIVEGGTAVVTGRVFVPDDVEAYQVQLEKPILEETHVPSLNSHDIYKELGLRGYSYSGLFQGIISCDVKCDVGHIKWNSNWVTFLDNMLQMKLLKEDTRDLLLPIEIEHLSIDCHTHVSEISNLNEDQLLDIYQYDDVGIIKSGGIEIRGFKTSGLSRRKNPLEPVLESYKFIPHCTTLNRKIGTALRINLQLALENTRHHKIKIVELLENSITNALSVRLEEILEDLPLVQSELVTILSPGCDNDLATDDSMKYEKKLKDEENCFLIVGQDLLTKPEVLQEALNALEENGFIISRETTYVELNIPSNLQIITSQICNDEKLLLIKKAEELKTDVTTIFICDDDDELNWLTDLQQAAKLNTRIILCSQSQPYSGILGLVKCIKKETEGLSVQCVFILDPTAPKFDCKLPVYKNQLDLNLTFNVFSNGHWGSYRHILLENNPLVTCDHSFANVTTLGDLSSFRWIQGPLSFSNKSTADQEIIQVHYSALNFRDIMIATGKVSLDNFIKSRLDKDSLHGFEFSGRCSSGLRLMGVVPSGGLSTILLADKKLMWEIPEDWSLEDAATVPVVYATAYYALVICGRVKKGMSILINAGSGGVGMAAIRLALHYNCTVYTTVGTNDKREFIKKQFPEIKDSQIGSSRNTSFEQVVLLGTKGRGVDIVLNSLSEEKLQASVRCLAPGGRFLEIGKFDLVNNSALRMGTFLKETSFQGVMLDKLFSLSEELETKKELHDLVSEGIRNGVVRPLVRTVFKSDEIEEAVRFMAAGKHIGKVIIKIRDEKDNRLQISPQIPSLARFYCNPNFCYIINGGLGGFGLELADWLVLRGARKLLLTSRVGLTTGYQAYRIQLWKSYGVTLQISTADCTVIQGCEKLILQAKSLGPVAAIFNLAAVLKDNILEDQSKESFMEAFKPKVNATKNLDNVSRNCCPELKNFVVFSSISSGRGIPGQTNYGMANSITERICEARVRDGFHGLAVQWGAIGEVGLVADVQELNRQIKIEVEGTTQQQVNSCLTVLDSLLNQKEPVVSSILIAEKSLSITKSENILDTIANLLGIYDIRTISLESTLAELGMDSIIAVEIKQKLELSFEVFYTAQEVRRLTFAKLQDLATKSELKQLSKSGDKVKNEISGQGLIHLMKTIGEENKSTQPIIRLPSSTPTGKIPEVAFLLPGIEGIACVMEPLAENLEFQVSCLQYDYNSTASTIQEIAQELLQHIRSNLSLDKTFNIVAYSFGAVCALEIVRTLESEGYRGRLWIIDGSPYLLKALIIAQMDTTSDHTLQVTMLCLLMDWIAPMDKTNFRQELLEMTEWEDQLNHFLAVLPPSPKHTKQYQKLIHNATLNRTKAGLLYDPSTLPKLKSKITLIKPREMILPNLDEDYGLSQHTKSPVDIHYVNGNHSTMLESKNCAEIINNFEDIVAENPLQIKSSIETKGNPLKRAVSFKRTASQTIFGQPKFFNTLV